MDKIKTDTTEARLMVNTSLCVYRNLIDEFGEARGTRVFAERVVENANLIEALEADGWVIYTDPDESDKDEQYLYGSKLFPSLDEALQAARALGAQDRTLGWGIGGDEDEYVDVGDWQAGR